MPRYRSYSFRKFPTSLKYGEPDMIHRFDEDEGSNPWRSKVTALANEYGGATHAGDREKGEVCRCVLPNRDQANLFVRALFQKYGLRGEIEPVWEWKSEKCVTVYEESR